jgi:hypothetical protein
MTPPEDIIHPVVSVSLEIYLCWWSHRGYHPPLVESSRIRPVVSVSLEIYLCWWSQRGYHQPSGQCFTGDILLPAESPRISSATGGRAYDILVDSTSRGISSVKH